MTATDLNGAAAPVIIRLARFGFAVKGIVTILIGALALRFTLGWGGDIRGPRGAIEALLDEPLGEINLAVLAAGLASYAIWMLVEAVMDPERKGAGFMATLDTMARLTP